VSVLGLKIVLPPRHSTFSISRRSRWPIFSGILRKIYKEAGLEVSLFLFYFGVPLSWACYAFILGSVPAIQTLIVNRCFEALTTTVPFLDRIDIESFEHIDNLHHIHAGVDIGDENTPANRFETKYSLSSTPLLLDSDDHQYLFLRLISLINESASRDIAGDLPTRTRAEWNLARLAPLHIQERLLWTLRFCDHLPR
jgi:hypothetical protein